MAAPTKGTELLELVRKSGLLEIPRLDAYISSLESEGALEEDPTKLASRLVKDGLISVFQARQMLRGRYRGFFLGKYKVLEPIGSGGMADVYLCEHTTMKHKVAIKILPIEKLKDPSLLGRFKREAQAIAALNHPNVVRAFDLDNEGNLHYLVTEYVDGCNLQDFIKKNGPMDPARAANYIAQAAAGLQHIQEAELVHRDIKPGNLLLDRSGVVKLLDLGLARFSDIERQDNLTQEFDDGRVLGTADYIAPEQGIKGSDVDIRADIYSLGATFYFMLKGEAPFEGASVTQKLLFHQIKEPPPLPDSVPADIADLVKQMMAKKPVDRIQSPGEVVERLLSYATQVVPPLEAEMPPRSLALGAQTKPAGPKSSARLSGRMAMTSVAHATLGPASSRGGPVSGGTYAGRSGPVSGASMAAQSGGIAAMVPDIVEDDEPVDQPDRLMDREEEEEEASFFVTYKWPLIGGAGMIVLGTVIFLIWLINSAQQTKLAVQTKAFSAIPRDDDPEDPSKSAAVTGDLGVEAGKMPAWVAKGSPKGQPPAKALIVSSTGGAGRHKTIKSAILTGGSEAHIVIMDAEHKEQVVIDGSQGIRNVTIEGWSSSSTPIALSYSESADVNQPLIKITGIEGLKLKDLVLKGKGKEGDVLSISGDCPGLVLENVSILDIPKNGVRLANARGTAAKPMRLTGVQIANATEVDAAIRLDSLTQHVVIEKSRFDGPFRGAITTSGLVTGIVCQENRFVRNIAGVLYQGGGSEQHVEMVLKQNVFFAQRDAAIYFAQVLAASNPPWEVKDNLFLSTLRLAAVKNVRLEMPSTWTGKWIWSNEGQGNNRATIPACTRYFQKVVVLPQKPETSWLHVSCKDRFVIWVNGVKVGASDQKYYNQRVYRYDVSKVLKAGSNILAVEAIQEGNDPVSADLGTAAGLIVCLTDKGGSMLASTDESWKVSDDRIDGFQENLSTEQDSRWAAVKPWVGEPVVFPWKNAVWDESVQTSLAGKSMPMFTASNNVHDYLSWEGYPNLNSMRGNVEGSKGHYGLDTANNATFLRYPRTSALFKLGTGGQPVGIPQD